MYLVSMGYYLDLSDPYQLCFWPCQPQTCLMEASEGTGLTATACWNRR